MCVLRLVSKTKSFKQMLEGTNLPIYSVNDAGEYRDKAKKRLCENYQATMDVSDKEWDDLSGQINDAIFFLNEYHSELEEIFKHIDDIEAGLDFPIHSILGEKWVTQWINFPAELVSVAGKLNIDIGMTLYAKDLFN